MLFARVVAEWREFYLFLGVASATLLGLLFVAVSVRIDALQDARLSGLREFALHAFATLFGLVVLSAAFLVPAQSPAGLGVPLLGIAGIELVLLGHVMTYAFRTQLPPEPLRRARPFYYGLSLLAHAALLALAIALVAGSTGVLYGLFIVVAVLLGLAGAAAWLLVASARTPM